MSMVASAMVMGYWKSGEVFNSKKDEIEFEAFLTKYEALEKQLRYLCLKEGIEDNVFITYEHHDNNANYPKLVFHLGYPLSVNEGINIKLRETIDNFLNDYIDLGFSIDNSLNDVIYIMLKYPKD